MFEFDVETIARLNATGEAINALVFEHLESGVRKERITEELVATFTVIPIDMDGSPDVLPMDMAHASRVVDYLEGLWKREIRRNGLRRIVQGIISGVVLAGLAYGLAWFLNVVGWPDLVRPVGSRPALRRGAGRNLACRHRRASAADWSRRNRGRKAAPQGLGHADNS